MLSVSLDFNNELGSNGQSYKLANKSYLKRIELLENYASFVKKTTPQEGDIIDRKATVWDMKFELSREKQAIIPDPTK